MAYSLELCPLSDTVTIYSDTHSVPHRVAPGAQVEKFPVFLAWGTKKVKLKNHEC